MREADRPRFVVALTTLAEVFGRPLTVTVIDAWFESLAPYPIDLVAEALGQWLATNSTGFMPVPGQIAESVNSMPPFQRGRLLPEPEPPRPTEQEAREFLARLREMRYKARGGEGAGAVGPKPFPQRDEASGAPESASGADHDREKTP